MSPAATATKDAYLAVLADIVWPVAIAWQRLLDATDEPQEQES